MTTRKRGIRLFERINFVRSYSFSFPIFSQPFLFYIPFPIISLPSQLLFLAYHFQSFHTVSSFSSLPSSISVFITLYPFSHLLSVPWSRNMVNLDEWHAGEQIWSSCCYLHIRMRVTYMKGSKFDEVEVVVYSGLRRCHWTMVCLGFVIISCQCFVSLAPLPFFPTTKFGRVRYKVYESLFISEWKYT